MGLFKDLAGAIGSVTGSILAVPAAMVAETLGLTEEMVKKAKDAGCETYEEIREFFKD